MENREAFTGISAEPEEGIDEVNWYWNERRATGRNNALRYTKKHQINEVDEANSVNDEDYQYDEENVNTHYEGIEEINFSYSEFTKEEDLIYYNDN